MISCMATAARLIREARKRAGLTQDELARRLGTTQSAVARWEAGATEPAFGAVLRAVRACGLELHFGIATPDHDHARLIAAYRAMTPKQRLDDLVERVAVQRALRGAARR